MQKRDEIVRRSRCSIAIQARHFSPGAVAESTHFLISAAADLLHAASDLHFSVHEVLRTDAFYSYLVIKATGWVDWNALVVHLDAINLTQVKVFVPEKTVTKDGHVRCRIVVRCVLTVSSLYEAPQLVLTMEWPKWCSPDLEGPALTHPPKDAAPVDPILAAVCNALGVKP